MRKWRIKEREKVKVGVRARKSKAIVLGTPIFKDMTWRVRDGEVRIPWG